MKIFLLFFMSYVLIFEITHAQPSNRDRLIAPQKIPKPAPTPRPTNTQTFDRITPKCYPETATAYFLPAPPSSPKISVLNPKDVPTLLNQNLREKSLNIFKELPASSSVPPPKEMSSRIDFPPPPPPCLTGLKDLIDDIPIKTKERISRLVECEEKVPVCESCVAALKKLPIFNFDQEVLDGFLAGIGI